jgi:glycosyltransferase involved in cell wall biosynthesis
MLRLVALVLEGAFRALARRHPTIAVGPDLAHRYRHSPAVLDLAVSLVRQEDLAPPAVEHKRDYRGELRVVSVGRLETEKNPILLAEALAALNAGDRRWRLVVCGEGALAGALADRLEQLGVAHLADLRGYIPLHEGLLDLYRGSHALLHVSWTEGVPQILFEAFASRLPVVATAVGGVPAAVGDAALLVPPGDADAIASALSRIALEDELRKRLTESGARLAERRNLEAEAARVAGFLRAHTTGSPTGLLARGRTRAATPLTRRSDWTCSLRRAREVVQP